MFRVPLPSRVRPRVALACALAVAAGCATSRSKESIAWPPPPDKPRVKFVRAFVREDDLRPGFFRRVLRIVIPASPRARVARPTGLALSPDERFLYIACSSASTVLRLDRTGRKLDVVADEERHRANRPFSVATDADGNLYVSDMAQDMILVYGPGGEGYKRQIKDDKLQKPTGIAIDRRRQLLYAVSGVNRKSQHHRVEVFSLAGKHLRTIGTRGSNPGDFNFPANLAVSKDGNLYVVDMLNFRVQIFDPDGQLVTVFGTSGAGHPGTFDKAKSVALDSFGNVYVVDSQAAHVQMFNPRFQVLMAFGGRFADPGFFQTPTAIAIDSKNTIFVAEFFGSWVAEYQLVDTTAADSFIEDESQEKKAKAAEKPSPAPRATPAAPAEKPSPPRATPAAPPGDSSPVPDDLQ